MRALVFELQAELWYLSFKLSYRDLVAMMGERGIGLIHTTILRGCSITPPSSRSVGAVSAEPSAVPGAWMKLL